MSDDQLLNDNSNAHLSPTLRARLQQCYAFGNQKMQGGDHDYANEMFRQCFLGNMSNLIYLQSFVANLRLKYKNNKKGAAFASIKTGKSRTSMKVAENRARHEDVLRLGAEILELNPWDSATFFAMGKAALELGYDDTGLALLKHAIECNPNDVDINRFAAQQLSERNMYTDAIACCQRIINAKKVDREASRMIGDLMLRQTMDQMESKKEKNKRDAAERAEAPQVPEEDVYEKKLAKTPDDRDLWLSYADFYFQKKNYRKAEDTFRRALKNFPDDVDFTVRLLELQKLRARDEVVRAKELLAKNPDDAALKECFAKLREAFDEKTLALIKHKLSVNPTATATRYEHGIYLVQHGQFAEAIAELQTAQQDESIRSDCALAIAFCFEKLKKYKLAMTNYETAIRLLGNKVSEPIKRALYGAARLSAVLGDYKTAEQYATRLAGIDFSYKDIAQLLDKITERLQN